MPRSHLGSALTVTISFATAVTVAAVMLSRSQKRNLRRSRQRAIRRQAQMPVLDMPPLPVYSNEGDTSPEAPNTPASVTGALDFVVVGHNPGAEKQSTGDEGWCVV